jgi:hypothetical protein
MKFLIAAACLVTFISVSDAAAADAFYGAACDGSTKVCKAAKNLACGKTIKKCTCKAGTFVGEYIGDQASANAASAGCDQKCDTTNYKCGTNAECSADKKYCQCKAGFVYDSSKNEVNAQTDSNFVCANSKDAAGCKSADAKGTAPEFDATSKLCKCKDSAEKLTYVKKDGKYDCVKPAAGASTLVASAVSLCLLVVKMW